MPLNTNTQQNTLDEAAITRMVHTFYGRILADELLAPVFNHAIAAHRWPAHLDTMSAFWSSIMLSSGRYRGKPMQAHEKHRELITPEMFTRWLELWSLTATEVLSPALASAMTEKAHTIARNLQHALFVSPPSPLRIG